MPERPEFGQAGARRWISAVNQWGMRGQWRYAKIHSPHQLSSVLDVGDQTGARR